MCHDIIKQFKNKTNLKYLKQKSDYFNLSSALITSVLLTIPDS